MCDDLNRQFRRSRILFLADFSSTNFCLGCFPMQEPFQPFIRMTKRFCCTSSISLTTVFTTKIPDGRYGDCKVQLVIIHWGIAQAQT